MDESIDAMSESWCSVHFPPSQIVETPPLATSAKADWVADWLLSLQTNAKLHAVHYEPQSSQQQASLCAVNLDETAASTKHTRLQRSASDASLADFLKCRGPCRPSFLDHRGSYRESQAKLSASDSAMPKPRAAWASVRQPQCQQQRRRHVGWVAERLDESSLCESQHGHLADNVADKEAGSARMPREIKAPAVDEPKSAGPSSIATAQGSAEFLSQAIHHFVAFQPLDFVPRSPVAPAGSGSAETLANAAVSVASAGLANIRSYFSGIMDEFTREDALFIQ
ncbi:hypothetical protein EV183_004895 [Coemansia sp. RSA 2336]|nr:hypothetical protein EV183_004895 [Coemansia sp. RSA 2336]